MKFSVAIAKWHMSNEVKPIHVNEALELYKASLSTFGMHFEDGEFINESSLKKTEDGRRIAIDKAYNVLKNEKGYAFESEVIDKAVEYGCFTSRGQAQALMGTLRMECKLTERDNMIKISWK